ncbi:MAG: Asp-tRNA(Asn)/Glu-tRNA(Gln) amidotransferase subunit GatC [Armatimonadetes bacterium]|nr:Asp-tRNA(Asn)/Glu-tRNA(Gln) amidotransferase subunit GatC [Armatimonadota bacterium]MDW8028221.1 Asp-tRNA(Asn)/Glu-tRNA(Gln) amidotransferase subunit GatC [Armatimonadota bacterium]
MPLSREEVLHVALLARLELSEEEIERYAWELNRVLEHIEKLKELDVEGVEPTSHAVPLSNVFRPDKPSEPMPKEEVLMNAPDAVDGYFRVPRVVEET